MDEEIQVTDKNDGSVLDDNVAATLYKEISQGYREWDFGDKKYRTRFPNSDEDSKGRLAYARSFNAALEDGLRTQKQMQELLKSRGIWTDDDEAEVANLREKVGQLEVILSKKDIKDKSKRTHDLAEELAETRIKLFEKTSVYQDYMNQTVESIADERKTAVLISLCTENADGTRVWDGLDGFLNDKNAALVSTATYQYVTYINGMPENYVDQLTEVQFLKAGQEPEKKK